MFHRKNWERSEKKNKKQSFSVGHAVSSQQWKVKQIQVVIIKYLQFKHHPMGTKEKEFIFHTDAHTTACLNCLISSTLEHVSSLGAHSH